MDITDGWGTSFDDATMSSLRISADALGLVILQYGAGLWILTDPLHVSRMRFTNLNDLSAQITFLQANPDSAPFGDVWEAGVGQALP